MASLGCSDNAGNAAVEASINREDLDRASLKIVAGQPAEAATILEKLNRDFPKNTEVLELLGWARSETGDYLEAAFWYEQAADRHPNGASFLKRAGECYELAGEDASASLSYSAYVALEPSDGHVWHKLYQLRARAARVPGLSTAARKQLETDALNAILKAKGAATPDEALDIARLFQNKNILPEAEFWFEAVSVNPEGDQRGALLGLLEVHLARRADDKAESIARLLNKRFPGSIDDHSSATDVIRLLSTQHAATLFERGFDPEGRTVSELFLALKADTVANIFKPVKLPLTEEPSEEPQPETPQPSSTGMRLADLFNFDDTPGSTDQNASAVAEKAADFLERAELALLDQNPRGAQLFLREAIKEEPDNATAWYLRSRAHLMASEAEEAEMTATEAVRLAGASLEIRLHFIDVARPVLSPRRFLVELDKAHEDFPQSLDVLWQLARQYHYVEEKTVIAAILYRRFLATAPAGHPMLENVQRELASLGNL